MKLYSETNLSNFEFWSGAKTNAEKLKSKQMDQIESTLEDIYSNGLSETELNDLFWFDFETVAEWIGMSVCENCGDLYQGICLECEEEEEEEETI